MPSSSLSADSPIALIRHAERLGLGALLDARLLDWFEASELSPLTSRLVQRLALTQGCGTPRALLENGKVWEALGKGVARTALDDLGNWLAQRAAHDGLLADEGVDAGDDEGDSTPLVPQRSPEPHPLLRRPDPFDSPGDRGTLVPFPSARAAAPPLPATPPPNPSAIRLAPGMRALDLLAWARARGVARELDRTAQVLDDRVVGRARYWLWRGLNATIGDVIVTTPRQRHADAVPEEIQEAAIAWLEGRAERHARARLDEAARLDDAVAPDDLVLRPLWDRVLAERTARRAATPPVPNDELEAVRIGLVEDPPTWTADDGWPRVAPACARAQLALQAPADAPLVGCHCEKPDCPLALVALDTLIAALGAPDHPRRARVRDLLATPAWERALRELDTLSEPIDDAVLGWRIEPKGAVTPVLCTPKKRGAGWKVAKLPREDLVLRPELCALPADRDVRDIWLHDREGAAFPTLVARLAGHPRVFAGSAPLVVRKVALTAEWEETDDGGVRIGFRAGARPVTVDDLSTLDGPGWLVLPDEAAIDVCFVHAEAGAFVEILGRRGGVFPPEARDAVLARLGALSRAVPARVAPAIRGRAHTASPVPLVRLDPLAEGGLLVTALVRALPGGLAFPPGEGPDELHEGTGDDRVFVARALPEEPALVRAALATLPLPAEDAPFTWTLTDADAALDLVAALRDHPIAVEWAGPPRRAKAASAGNLSLRVTSGRDWLDVNGALEVDGATVQLGALLAAVLAGKRYVAVDDATWVRLGEDLATKLAVVAEVAEVGIGGDGGGQRKAAAEVPKLAAAALDALGAAGAHVDAPLGWDDLVRKARDAEGYTPELPAGFTADLRDYQRAGFAWLARLARWAPGAVLADDMGLGKTVQALALLAHRAELGPALVVAPTSVGFNWLREAARFAPGLRVVPLRGPDRTAALADAAPGVLFVTSWDLLARDADALAAVPFATLVLDEAQAMKNATTARAKAAARLDATFRVALTGTPVENRVSELWSLFRVVTPGLLGSWERFRQRYALAIERDGDARRRAALARLIRPFLLRRHKAEVATELPPRTDIRVEVELSADERRLYDAARAAFLAELGTSGGPPEQRRFKVLAALTRLRQLACHPKLLDADTNVASSKLARLLELVAELRDEGHRALVFSQFTRQLALVREALDAAGVPYRYLDGDTPAERRRDEVDAFQRGEGDVFLISLKAGGTGLTLTAATYVLHLDPWWNPAVEDQASDRAHRIGQTQPVTVYRLVAKGTIEEKILALHGEKRALVEGLLEGTGAAATLGTEELVALLSEEDVRG